jgi:hypothetical protein
MSPEKLMVSEIVSGEWRDTAGADFRIWEGKERE